MHGYGTLTHEDQKQGYTGWWASNVFEGFGTETNILNGITYEYTGEWRNSVKEGYGHFRIGDDFEYVGDHDSDEFSGKGLMRLGSGVDYLGGVKASKKEGHGVLIKSEGAKQEFCGEWLNDKREGPGVLIRTEALQALVGNWKGNQLDGLVLDVDLAVDDSDVESKGVKVAIYRRDKKILQLDQVGP